jgi:alcohol dehydrogenase (quinone), cytochrome c subunit
MIKTLALSSVMLAGLSVSAFAADDEQALITKGEYIARAGDCVACHTAPGGKPFAGGLPITADFGTIFTTNITPDKEHGIGNYTEEQFSAAVRDGIRADGAHLYPAMPYPSYRKLTDGDLHALYVYFMKGVKPDASKPQETSLSFPYSQRWGMFFWNLVFSGSKFQADPKASAEVNRGAYLVEGLGHCGACHTPRGLGMNEEAYDGSSSDFLAGADLNGWHAPQLRAGGNAGRGVSTWSQQEIVDYLGKGRNDHAAVGGEMTSVIEHSMSYMTDADLNAIAAYLKSLPVNGKATVNVSGSKTTTDKLTAAKDLTPGERLYVDNCGACHFVTGKGAPNVFPQLDGASIVNAKSPVGLIHTILAGAQTPSTARAPSVLPMPGFAGRLSDEDVATLATFVRQGWSNSAPAVTAKDVAEVRKSVPKIAPLTVEGQLSQ